MVPDRWKVSLIRCFLQRATRLSSTQKLLDKEITTIKQIFMSNSYPEDFIVDNICSYFESTKKHDITPCIEPEEQDQLQRKYMVLPYMGKCSEKLHHRIKRVMLQYGFRVLPAFRTTKVASYFSLKMKIPILFKNNVVYRFKCLCDKDTQYIGETERQFFQRIAEHCKPSQNISAVFNHLNQCTDCEKSENIAECFTILRQCNRTDVLSQEALCIKRFQPSLNIQLGPYKGSRVGMTVFN